MSYCYVVLNYTCVLYDEDSSETLSYNCAALTDKDTIIDNFSVNE